MVRHDNGSAGAFRWSRGGWFGSQFGATIWPLLLGVGVATEEAGLGALLIALAVAPNLVGFALWRRRDTLAPYPALQILVAVCGFSMMLAMVGVRAHGLSLSSLGMSAWLLLLYPGIMLAFDLRERSARKAAA
jgi:hypothetical protein